MRLIDAAVKDLETIGDCRTCGNKNPFCDSNPDSCSGYKWRGVSPDAADNNEPLTPDQLLEMDGEPVWICDPDGSDGILALVDLEYELCRTAKGGLAIFDTYGKTWLAYRRKPENKA